MLFRSHLRGKPYHISALYKVDLDVFRSFCFFLSCCASEASATFCERCITVCPRTLIRYRIWIRTFRTLFRIRCPFTVCLRNGCGASRGAAWRPRRTRRQSTCAIIRSIRWESRWHAMVGTQAGHGEACDFGTAVQAELGGAG